MVVFTRIWLPFSLFQCWAHICEFHCKLSCIQRLWQRLLLTVVKRQRVDRLPGQELEKKNRCQKHWYTIILFYSSAPFTPRALKFYIRITIAFHFCQTISSLLCYYIVYAMKVCAKNLTLSNCKPKYGLLIPDCLSVKDWKSFLWEMLFYWPLISKKLNLTDRTSHQTVSNIYYIRTLLP